MSEGGGRGCGRRRRIQRVPVPGAGLACCRRKLPRKIAVGIRPEEIVVATEAYTPTRHFRPR